LAIFASYIKLEKSGLPSNIIAFKQFDHGIQEGGVVKASMGLLCFQDKEPTEGVKKESADLFVQRCATGASSVESFFLFPEERDHLQPSNSDFYLEDDGTYEFE